MNFAYIKDKALVVFGTLVLSVLLLLANGMGLVKPVYSSLNAVVRPVEFWMGRVALGIRNTFSTITSITSLKSQNSDLKIEKAKLEAQLGKLNEIQKENESLRTQLSLRPSKKWKLEMVRLLGIDHEVGAEHIIVDKGENFKVEVGDPVILGDMLIGQVSDVFEATARVKLVSNRDSNIYAIDQNTRAKGIIRGSLDGVVMEDILGNEKINSGDTIVTWSDKLPGGLVIGRIKSIDKNPTSATQKAFVDVGLSFEDISYAFVVIDR